MSQGVDVSLVFRADEEVHETELSFIAEGSANGTFVARNFGISLALQLPGLLMEFVPEDVTLEGIICRPRGYDECWRYEELILREGEESKNVEGMVHFVSTFAAEVDTRGRLFNRNQWPFAPREQVVDDRLSNQYVGQFLNMLAGLRDNGIQTIGGDVYRLGVAFQSLPPVVVNDVELVEDISINPIVGTRIDRKRNTPSRRGRRVVANPPDDPGGGDGGDGVNPDP